MHMKDENEICVCRARKSNWEKGISGESFLSQGGRVSHVTVFFLSIFFSSSSSHVAQWPGGSFVLNSRIAKSEIK